MDQDFWHQRWAANQIGFHLPEANPSLVRYWPRLGLDSGSRVFVPLCGKSLDLLWLLEQGHRVVGVEISRLAVAAFFEENGLVPEIRQEPRFSRWRRDELELLCGDFFDLQAADLGPVAGVFDRAALIAMPPAMRPGYAAQLGSLLEPGTQCLLITLSYNQLEMNGPPFAVTNAEVGRLFDNRFTITRLHTADVLAAHGRFREAGLSALVESVWQLLRL
ncbi:MAG: thiopurine S-methyltransferase [Gammaproteobacteria bacterium]|jgi:thiopurine S-methyltransferase